MPRNTLSVPRPTLPEIAQGPPEGPLLEGIPSAAAWPVVMARAAATPSSMRFIQVDPVCWTQHMRAAVLFVLFGRLCKDAGQAWPPVIGYRSWADSAECTIGC